MSKELKLSHCVLALSCIGLVICFTLLAFMEQDVRKLKSTQCTHTNQSLDELYGFMNMQQSRMDVISSGLRSQYDTLSSVVVAVGINHSNIVQIANHIELISRVVAVNHQDTIQQVLSQQNAQGEQNVGQQSK